MSDVKTEYYQDKRGEWRWRKTHRNGQVIGASSEGYVNKADCQANANRKAKNGDKWEFYKDKKGEHRWRCFAANGKQVGRSTEGYKAKRDAENNATANGWPGKG
jgi:uncharacterized protein YegP (UPF0339 family)